MAPPAAETALRERARRLQALHVRLLFCERTRESWRAAPEAVLGAFGLPAEAGARLADLDSPEFRAEAHGRKAGVRKAVARCFAKTFDYLEAMAAAADGPPPPGFDDFLCSDHFFDPGRGLPHASGVGPGYENTSKFFFWLRDGFALDRPGADVALRNTAYAEFAAYLINEYRRPHEAFYDRFRGGIYWRRAPGKALPVMLLSDKYVLFTLGNPNDAARLPGIGLVDLDRLAPPAARRARTI